MIAQVLHAAPQSASVSFQRELDKREEWEWESGGEEGVEEQQPSINNPLPGPEMRTAGFRGAAFPPLSPTADRQDK